MKCICFPGLLLVLMFSGLLCNYTSIDKYNCHGNNRMSVNKNNATVQFKAKFSSTILSKNCVIYISNSDFQANRIYEVIVKLSGNITRRDHFNIRIYTGHPDNNQPIKILDNTVQKWSGQLPSWDMYVGMVSHTVTELDVQVTIQECNENCYPMNLPSVIPTHIVNVPDQCNTFHCLDKYSVSYHIRTNFYRHQTCGLNFTVRDNPSICLTIGDHWTDSIIKSTKCRTLQIRRGTDVVLTLDRLIFKPWCLPWTFEGKHLSIVWGNDTNVSGQSLCTLTLYTNTSSLGANCFGATTTAAPHTDGKDNTTIMTIVTVISLLIMIILAILIIYFIVTRSRRQTESHIVANFHQSSVQVMSPPPYSIAVSDEIPSYQQVIQQDQATNNSDEAYHTDTTSSSSVPDSNISPPPYSES